MLLGELLLKQNLVKEEDLEEALKEQKESKRLLGAILAEKGLITAEKLSEVLHTQKTTKTISLSRTELSADVVKIIPERLAKRFLAIAVYKEGKALSVAMADPGDIIAIDNIRSVTGHQITVLKAKSEEILSAISKHYYGFEGSEEPTLEVGELEIEKEEDDSEITFQADDPPVIKHVNLIFVKAIERRASDIHLEPMDKKVSLRFRVDGVLRAETAPPAPMYPGIVSRIKIITDLDVAERRRPQDGRCEIRIGQKLVDLRISTFPTVFGEKVVIRVLDRSSLVLDMKELGMEPQQLTMFQESLKKPHGIVLVTGPTGSGKTTSLYAGLSYLNDPEKNIITLEDPVEYRLQGINQTQIRPEIGLTFAAYLRYVMRQDPDIIMIGEIRDFETAEIAIRAALTGHLVLSTIHTNDSVSTITRLINMGIDPYLIPPSLNAIISQRLIRKLCPECKEPATESDLLPVGTVHYQPKGCNLCNNTGYWGRLGIYEVLEITRELNNLISGGETNDKVLREEAKKEGLQNLFQIGLHKVAQGITSLVEVLTIAEDK